MLATDRLQRTADPRGAHGAALPTSAPPRQGRTTVLATPRIVLGLRTIPLLVCAGALVLSTGLHRDDDVLFALGGLVVLAGIALFQVLRLRLIARCEAEARDMGEPNAYARAVREADALLATFRNDDPLSARPDTASVVRADSEPSPEARTFSGRQQTLIRCAAPDVPKGRPDFVRLRSNDSPRNT